MRTLLKPGSGKSYTASALIDRISELSSYNAILIDTHCEFPYCSGTYSVEYVNQTKIAESATRLSNGIMLLPYWLLTYENMLALMLEHSDSSVPNQALVFSLVEMERQGYRLNKSGRPYSS